MQLLARQVGGKYGCNAFSSQGVESTVNLLKILLESSPSATTRCILYTRTTSIVERTLAVLVTVHLRMGGGIFRASHLLNESLFNMFICVMRTCLSQWHRPCSGTGSIHSTDYGLRSWHVTFVSSRVSTPLRGDARSRCETIDSGELREGEGHYRRTLAK